MALRQARFVPTRDSVRVLLVLLGTLIVTVIVNSTYSVQLPLRLPDGRRPGIPKGTWAEQIRYVNLHDVADRLTAGQAVLVDLRYSDDFDESHALGSINLPYDELDDVFEDFLDEVSPDQELYIWCEGLLCGMSERLAKDLLDAEYTNVAVIKQGFDAWEQLDLPVATESQ